MVLNHFDSAVTFRSNTWCTYWQCAYNVWLFVTLNSLEFFTPVWFFVSFCFGCYLLRISVSVGSMWLKRMHTAQIFRFKCVSQYFELFFLFNFNIDMHVRLRSSATFSVKFEWENWIFDFSAFHFFKIWLEI